MYSGKAISKKYVLSSLRKVAIVSEDFIVIYSYIIMSKGKCEPPTAFEGDTAYIAASEGYGWELIYE